MAARSSEGEVWSMDSAMASDAPEQADGRTAATRLAARADPSEHETPGREAHRLPQQPLKPGQGRESSGAAWRTDELAPPFIRSGEYREKDRTAERPARDAHTAAPAEPHVQIGTIEVVVLNPAPAERPGRREEIPAADLASRHYLRNL